jgi:centromere protein I
MLVFYTDLLDNWTSFVSNQALYENHASSITSLIQYATTLSLNILQTSQHQSSLHAILNFYESVVVTTSHPDLQFRVRITTPPAELVYALHFNSSISTVSRLSAILASYKRAFEAVMAPKAPGKQSKDIQVYNKDYVNHFNGFLMDVCNCLWRARALNNSDPNALGCLVDRQVVGALATYVSSLDTSLTLPSLFSFSTSPIMCLIAISYIRQLEDENEDTIQKRHGGPVSQASLKQLEIDGGLKLSWQDYKLGVLQYLENIGIEGVGELMYNTMKHLMSTRTKKI